MGSPDRNIRDTNIIGSDCLEQFLPLASPAGTLLKSLDISLAGISTLQGEYEIARRNPNWHVLLYTISGRGHVETDTGAHDLKRGTVLFLPRYTSHRYQLARKDWQIMWFHLRPMETWAYLEQRTWSVAPAMHLRQLKQACLGLLYEEHHRDVEAERAGQLYAELIALYLHRELSYLHNATEWRTRENVRLLWAEIDSSLQQDWGVPRMARQAHVSEGHFHRLMQEIYGATPMDKLLQMRMQRAESLLRSSDQPAYQVAEQVGYQNPYAFSTAYKRYHGVSPREHRRR
jgi:AraC-like DNA-binding protein